MTTTNTTRIQYRGTCAACGNQQAVSHGALAQHGYRRPSWIGGNVGSCWGSYQQANEQSPELARKVLAVMQADLAKHAGSSVESAIRYEIERVEALLIDWAPKALTEVAVQTEAAKYADRNTLTDEERARLKPIQGSLGMSWVDRGGGCWAIVHADKVVETGRGAVKRNQAVVMTARWLKEKAQRSA